MPQIEDEDFRKSHRLGCLSPFLFGGLGLSTAFVIGWIDAPMVDPQDPLAYEGYTPFVIVVLLPLGLILGAMVGWVAGSAWDVAGLKVTIWGMIGLLLGLAVGKMIHYTQNPSGGWPLIVHLLISGGTAFLGLLLATWSTESRSRLSSKIRENDD